MNMAVPKDVSTSRGELTWLRHCRSSAYRCRSLPNYAGRCRRAAALAFGMQDAVVPEEGIKVFACKRQTVAIRPLATEFEREGVSWHIVH